MIKPSLITKIISLILVAAFLSSQVYADVSSIANDKLSPSLISDPNINPERNIVRNDIAEKAEPGAIGNGAPLLALAQGKLPHRITVSESENGDITRKLLEAINVAIKLSIANQNKIPPQHQARAKQALANLITLQQNLSKDAYLYNADIRGAEDYLIGFNFQNYRGYSVELIARLYNIFPERLAQYIYHECVPEKGIITERDDHRAVYDEIQSAVFGKDEVAALKKNFRDFINEMVLQSNGKAPMQLSWSKDRPSYIFLDGDSFLWSGSLETAARIYGEIYWRIVNGIDVKDTRMPSEHELTGGIEYFNRTLQYAEAEHLDGMFKELAAHGYSFANSKEAYIKLFELRLREQVLPHLQLMPGAKEFLEALAQKKREGYPIKIYVLSYSSQFGVDLITRHLRIHDLFDGAFGSPWGSTHDTYNKTQKILEIAGIIPGAFVVMAGDSCGDVRSAIEATKNGCPTISFGVPSGTATQEELVKAGASFVADSLEQTQKIFDHFGPQSENEKRRGTAGISLPLEPAKSLTLAAGVSQPTINVQNNPAIRERFKKLSQDIYPQQLLTRMKQDVYDPVIIGYDHADLGNVSNIKSAFEAIRQDNPGQRIKVAYEMIPAVQLRYLKDFVKDEREYNLSGTIGGKTPSSSTASNLRGYRAKIQQNGHHAEILALWLLDNGFDLIPINSENAESWMREDEHRVGYANLSHSSWSHLVRPALTAIRSDIYGLEVIERERPHIISVGSAHALKYDILLERNGSRSFYFFLDYFSWDKLLNLWEEAHSLFHSYSVTQGRNSSKPAQTNRSTENRNWGRGSGFGSDDYEWFGSPAKCLDSIIEYCKGNLEKDFSAQELFDNGYRKKKDEKTDFSLDTIKLELRQLYQAGVLDIKYGTKPLRYALRPNIRKLSSPERDIVVSTIRSIPELNHYRTSPKIIKSIVRSQVEKIISRRTQPSTQTVEYSIAGQNREVDIHIPSALPLDQQITQVTFVFDVDKTLTDSGNNGITKDNMEQILRAARIQRESPNINIKIILISGSAYKSYVPSRLSLPVKDWNWTSLREGLIKAGCMPDDADRVIARTQKDLSTVPGDTRAFPNLRATLEHRVVLPLMDELRKAKLEDFLPNIEVITATGGEEAIFNSARGIFEYRQNLTSQFADEQLAVTKALVVAYLTAVGTKLGKKELIENEIATIGKTQEFLGERGVSAIFQKAVQKLGLVDIKILPFEHEIHIVFDDERDVDGVEVANAALDMLQRQGVLRQGVEYRPKGGSNYAIISLVDKADEIERRMTKSDILVQGGDSTTDSFLFDVRFSGMLNMFFGKRSHAEMFHNAIIALDENWKDNVQARGSGLLMKHVFDVIESGGTWGDVKFLNNQVSPNELFGIQHDAIADYRKMIPSASEFGVKAMVFDFGNIFHTFDYRNTAEEIHKRYDIDTEKAARHFEQRESDSSHWMFLYDKGAIDKTEAKNRFLSWVRKESGKPNVELTDDEFDRLMWTAWNEDIKEMYAMVKVAREKGYVVKVITTTNATHYAFTVNKIEGLLANGMSDIYASHIMRFDKRRPDIYLKVAKDAGLRPEQVLFIDDAEENIHAAASAGLQVALFKTGDIEGSVQKIIGILSQNFDSFLKGMNIPEVRTHLTALVEYMYGAYGVEAGDVRRMLDIIADSRTSNEAVQKVYAAGFRWNDPENKYGRKYRAYKTGTAPDIRSDAVRQFVRGPVVFDIATGNTSFFNKVIGPMREQITSARGSDIVVNEGQLHEIQAKAAKNSIVFLPQSLANPGKLPEGIEDHSVDTVTIVGALHHMTDEVRDSILREAHKILKPNGRLVVLEDTASTENPMTFATGTYKEDVRQKLLNDFNRMSRENQKYVFALVDWMGNHLAPGDTSIPLSFNFKTREEWHEIFRRVGFEVEAEANPGVTPYKFHTHPELIFSLKPVPQNIDTSKHALSARAFDKSGKVVLSGNAEAAHLVTQISEDLPVHAQIFKTNLEKILAEHPDQLFFMGIEADIGESQKAQIMPIHRAIDEIQALKDAEGKPLFPNLMVRRGKAEELVAMAGDLSREGKLNFNNVFIGARKVSVDSRVYDSIKGEGRAWISAIDDSRPGDYLPVFEAITLNMMAYLNADISAIKNFYDTIADHPIDPVVLQDMLRSRVVYILPKATAFDTKQLRELYELARQVYVAA